MRGAGGAAGPFGVILGRSFGEFVKALKEGLKEGLKELPVEAPILPPIFRL